MVQSLLRTCLFTAYTVVFESPLHLKMTGGSTEFLLGGMEYGQEPGRLKEWPL